MADLTGTHVSWTDDDGTYYGTIVGIEHRPASGAPPLVHVEWWDESGGVYAWADNCSPVSDAEWARVTNIRRSPDG